jgi:hypothetical protein
MPDDWYVNWVWRIPYFLLQTLQNPNRLSQAAMYVYFMLKNPSISREMGRVGKEYIAKNVNHEKMMNEYKNLYNKIINYQQNRTTEY